MTLIWRQLAFSKAGLSQWDALGRAALLRITGGQMAVLRVRDERVTESRIENRRWATHRHLDLQGMQKAHKRHEVSIDPACPEEGLRSRPLDES